MSLRELRVHIAEMAYNLGRMLLLMESMLKALRGLFAPLAWEAIKLMTAHITAEAADCNKNGCMNQWEEGAGISRCAPGRSA
jgi:hypothetical protein